MATTAQLIKRHISGLDHGQIFCTRELLGYGKRNNIDNVLHRLVKTERITRLARGVFCKSSHRPATLSCWHVLEAKLKAWGKVFWTASDRIVEAVQFSPSRQIAVYVSGASSAFTTEDGVRCHLKGIGQRKMKLGESQAGNLARQIWIGGKQQFLAGRIDTLLLHLSPRQTTEFLSLFKLLPAWMNDALHHIRSLRFGASLSEVCRLGPQSRYCQLEVKLCPS